MPPLPAVSKVVQVALGINPGTLPPVITRFFIQYTGTAPTNADLSTFNTAVSSAFNTSLKSLLDNNRLLISVESIDLSSAVAAVASSTVSVSGTRAGTELPISVAVVDSYTIARRYRGGHPRGYWPFGVAADLTDRRNWSTTFTGAVNTGINAFFTAVVAAGWAGAGTLTHVNVSYYKGFTVVTSPTTGRARNIPTLRVTPTVDAVTATLARGSIGSQRRREQFVD